MDDLGQVSTEMIVLMAAVLAVAYLVVTSMYKTADETSSSLKNTTRGTIKKIKEIEKLI